MEKVYDYIIVGAGISGAVFACEAAKAGKTCLVIERREVVGGNCHQSRVGGILVHCYGAHIFRTNKKWVWDYLSNHGVVVPYINTPLGQAEGKIYNLPFNMNTFNQLWHITTPKEAKRRVKEQQHHYEEASNLEEWALNQVGWEVYKKFIEGYTEKQWGKPCRDLPPSIMKRIPIRYEYNNNYYSEAYQGVPLVSYDAIIMNMLTSENIDVALGTEFSFSQFEEKASSGIVYTGALDGLFDYEYGFLEWRGLDFKHRLYLEDNHQGVGVINHLDKTVPYTRTIEHKYLMPEQFRGAKTNFTVVTEEYPKTWSVHEEPYYPIMDAANLELQRKYEEKAKEYGVIPLGRLGQYKYMSMDEAIENSVSAAEAII